MLGCEHHLLSSCARLPWTALHPCFTCTEPPVHLCATGLFHPEFIGGNKQSSNIQSSISSFSAWKWESSGAIPLCCAGCTEQRAGALICSAHSEANKSCSGSSPNIQVGFTSTKALPACPAERSWGVIGHHWGCLINTKQRESPLSSVP